MTEAIPRRMVGGTKAERHRGPSVGIPRDSEAQATCLGSLDLNKVPAVWFRNILQKPAKVALKKTESMSIPQSLKAKV